MYCTTQFAYDIEMNLRTVRRASYRASLRAVMSLKAKGKYVGSGMDDHLRDRCSKQCCASGNRLNVCPALQDTSGPQVVRCLLVCWSTHMLSKHVLYPGRTVEQVLPVRLTQTFDTFPLPCAQKFFDVVSLLPPRKQNPQSSVTHLRTSS